MYTLRYFRSLRKFKRSQSIVANSCQDFSVPKKHKFTLTSPVLNEKYLLDDNNIKTISENAILRKGVGDIQLVHDLKNQLKNENLSADDKISLNKKLQDELRRIPNDTHPDVRGYGEEPKVVAYYNQMPEFKHNALEFAEICKKLNLLRTDHLGNYAGHKSYFLMSDLAELVSEFYLLIGLI